MKAYVLLFSIAASPTMNKNFFQVIFTGSLHQLGYQFSWFLAMDSYGIVLFIIILDSDFRLNAILLWNHTSHV